MAPNRAKNARLSNFKQMVTLESATIGLFDKDNDQFLSHLAENSELFWQLLTLDKTNPISQKFWNKFDGGVTSQKDVTMRMVLIDSAKQPNNSNVFLRAAQEQNIDLLIKLATLGANLDFRDKDQKSYQDYLVSDKFEITNKIYQLSPSKKGVVSNFRNVSHDQKIIQNDKLSEYHNCLKTFLEGYIEANKILESEKIDPHKGLASKSISLAGSILPFGGVFGGIGSAAASHIEGNITKVDLQKFAKFYEKLQTDMTFAQIADGFAINHKDKIDKLELERGQGFFIALGFKNNKIRDLAKEHAQKIFEVFVELESESAKSSPTRNPPSTFISFDNSSEKTIKMDELIKRVEDREDNLMLHKASSCLGCLGYGMRSNRVDAIEQEVQAEKSSTQQPSPQPTKSPLGRSRIDRLPSINVSSRDDAGKSSPSLSDGNESPLSAASTPTGTPIRVQGSLTAPNSAPRKYRPLAMKVEGSLTAPPSSPREFRPSAMEIEGSLTAPHLDGRRRLIYKAPSLPGKNNPGATSDPTPTPQSTSKEPQALSPSSLAVVKKGVEPFGGKPRAVIAGGLIQGVEKTKESIQF